MSRGHGCIERAVLEAVHDPTAGAVVADRRFGGMYKGSGAAGIPLGDLIKMLAGDSPTRSQIESIRRAVRTLVRQNKVEIRIGWNLVDDLSFRGVRYISRPPTDMELVRRAECEREAQRFMNGGRSTISIVLDRGGSNLSST